MSTESYRDPREVLAREKFFTVRPRPLERWIWRQGLPPSAERVFWLHWQAGLQSGDWCSAIALKAVAAECALDVSSVTRAYQLLAGAGLIRRQDPGRDPARPFQQAVAVTEVRVPREIVVELDRYPSRTRRASAPSNANVQPLEKSAPTESVSHAPSPSTPADPFAGLTGKERRRAMNELLAHLSAGERRRYDEAWLGRRSHIDFDADTQVTPEQRASVLWLLALMGAKPAAAGPARAEPARPAPSGPRRLSALELARLRRELQAMAQSTEVDERFREVVWSVEEGALTRFSPLHAVRIALKKLREGQWTRPNRMPPQWSRVLSRPRVAGILGSAAPESCRAA